MKLSKTCNKCKEVKTVEHFYKDKRINSSFIGDKVFPTRKLTPDELVVFHEAKIKELEALVGRSLLQIIWDRSRGKL